MNSRTQHESDWPPVWQRSTRRSSTRLPGGESKYAEQYGDNLARISELQAAINAHPANQAPIVGGETVTRETFVRHLISQAEAGLALLDQEEEMLGLHGTGWSLWMLRRFRTSSSMASSPAQPLLAEVRRAWRTLSICLPTDAEEAPMNKAIYAVLATAYTLAFPLTVAAGEPRSLENLERERASLIAKMIDIRLSAEARARQLEQARVRAG